MFKILSIDGGGIKTLASLQMLNKLENLYCKPQNTLLGDHFDMICGTSAGGLAALGISQRIPIEDIINIFKSNLNNLFPSFSKNKFINFWKTVVYDIKQLSGCKYNNNTLHNVGIKTFENTKMY